MTRQFNPKNRISGLKRTIQTKKINTVNLMNILGEMKPENKSGSINYDMNHDQPIRSLTEYNTYKSNIKLARQNKRENN